MDQQLVQKLQDDHGVAPEQSHDILNTIMQFIKDKVPAASGLIDQAFHGGSAPTIPTANDANPVATQGKEESTLEKIEDFAKSKLEGFLSKGL